MGSSHRSGERRAGPAVLPGAEQGALATLRFPKPQCLTLPCAALCQEQGWPGQLGGVRLPHAQCAEGLWWALQGGEP